MKKHQREREEVNKAWNEITPKEYDQLRAGMARFTQQRINGRLQSPWMQYMVELNVVRLDEWGDPVVRNAQAFTKWNQAQDNMDKRDEEELKAHWKSHPEERAKWEAKMTGFFKEIRDGAKVLNKSMKV